jgi:hypothetical protein
MPQGLKGGTAFTASTTPISNQSVAQTASALEGRGGSAAKTTVSGRFFVVTPTGTNAITGQRGQKDTGADFNDDASE